MTTDYHEGDWFGVPLTDSSGGFAIGLIARAQPKRDGVLLGYFFGPRRPQLPILPELDQLKPTDAVMVRLFSHLDIRDGKWPIIGRQPNWQRELWPMPKFLRRTGLGHEFLVEYDDLDPGRSTSTAKLGDRDPSDLVPEGLLGAGATETLLRAQL